ncbi:hypothetical protein [Demequina sp. NBRC 110052]|uniref:hypothetical protein n=1 Tax=Demequina sp. NBRC 110052 TaxID=1570341 RepID=UPI000A022DF5|nr:hypothetical protein [Demequina sp. NBRC 110052]
MRLRPGVPVLVRPDGPVQVGVARPILIECADPATSAALALMEPPGIPAAHGPAPATVARLRDAGLLADGPRETAEATVTIHGAGALGVEIGVALAAAGVGTRYEDAAPARVEPDAYSPRHVASTCAGAAHWTVAERSPWSPPPGEVVLGAAIALGGVSRTVTARWEFDGLPHLLISADEDGVDVGPLVVPGVTACAGCVAHHARERDPAWPSLLLQLEARRPWVDPRVLTEAAGTAARLLLTELSRRPDEAPVSSRWRLEPLTAPRQSEVTPHPACGCGTA